MQMYGQITVRSRSRSKEPLYISYIIREPFEKKFKMIRFIVFIKKIVQYYVS